MIGAANSPVPLFSTAMKPNVLFLCTGNSCRSQMAEGWARRLKGDSIEAFSAGTRPKGLDPLAVEVMREAGVDISAHRSKNINDLHSIPFDYVITVCDAASEACPTFPGPAPGSGKPKVIHRGFDDPPALARAASGEEERKRIYRRVRDEIRDFVLSLPQSLQQPTA